MKPINRCPKCNFNAPQPITKSADKFYCPKCKHAWNKGEEEKSLEESGTIDFEGVSQAKTIINTFLKNAKLAPEVKAALAAQLTNAFFEQWFEGFKTGLLADIVHKREFTNDNGKDSTESGETNREHRDGTGSPSVQASEDSSGQHQDPGPGKTFNRVKERVAGVNFIRPVNLEPTDKQYSECAWLMEQLGENQKSVDEVYFDGVHFNIKYKL